MASAELQSIIEALEASAGTPDERLALARAYLAAGDLTAAARIAADLPETAEALYLLGQIRGLLGDTAATAAAWQRALDLDPRHRKALLGLAALQADAGDTAAAAATYVIGLDQYPADPYLLFKLHALVPDHPWLLVARGDSRALEGDAEGALEAYQYASDRDPGDARIHWRMAWAARRSGYGPLAMEAWRQAAALRPDLLGWLLDKGCRLWRDADAH